LLEFNARILRMADGDSGGHEDQSSNSVARQTGFFKRIGTISALSSRPEVMELSKLAESKNAKFRCIGCDTYELGQGLAGELGARVASELLVNHNVRLRVYGKDDYGRLLVVVVLDAEIKNGEMLQIDWSKFIVRAGLGIRYKGSKHEDNAWYDKILDPLQAEAVDEEMGVWGWPENERPIAPDEWRARNRSNSQKRRTSPTQENRPSRQDPSSHNSANPNRFCANR
jgi:endonuclease YncB( thermonuclease family)